MDPMLLNVYILHLTPFCSSIDVFFEYHFLILKILYVLTLVQLFPSPRCNPDDAFWRILVGQEALRGKPLTSHNTSVTDLVFLFYCGTIVIKKRIIFSSLLPPTHFPFIFFDCAVYRYISFLKWISFGNNFLLQMQVLSLLWILIVMRSLFVVRNSYLQVLTCKRNLQAG